MDKYDEMAERCWGDLIAAGNGATMSLVIRWCYSEREKETCECVVKKPWLKPGDFCCDCGRRIVEVKK